MNKTVLIFTAAFFIISAGCAGVPKRDLSTREGIIAAHFTVPVRDVKRLLDEGYTEEECVGILFIESASHLREEDVKNKMKEDIPLEEIASGAGIPPETYRERTEWILRQVAEYSEEIQDQQEE